MIGWRSLIGFLLVCNLGLLAWGFSGAGKRMLELLTPGLRAEWVAVEKPWQQPVDLTQAPAPALPKINLKEGQAQLDKAIESASQQVTAANPVDGRQCLLWGPLLQSESARVQAALADWPGEMKPLEKQVSVGYVVYLPQDIVGSGVGIKQLSAKGVTDMFYISTPGPLQGTISLGLFRDLERARLQQQELARRGVDGVQIRERLGPTRVFFELRGLPAQMDTLRSTFELNRKGELKACEP